MAAVNNYFKFHFNNKNKYMQKLFFNSENVFKSFGISRRNKFTNRHENDSYDLVVVGGGIVGMAAAKEIASRHKSLRLAVVEKEEKVAFHQSGHNSGVIHAGIYYKPGTLKAKLCVEGMELAYRYCEEKKIPYKKCGKLIVATNDVEEKRLDDLYERGLKNQVKDLTFIEGRDIPKIEPNCVGKRALHSPHTGIVDWEAVTQQYAKDFNENGGKIYFNFKVIGFDADSCKGNNALNSSYPVLIRSKNQCIRSKYVLTCGGLYSDVISEMSGCSSEPKIVPFRGEYLLLKKEKCHLIKGNIYPVPDPRFPFLGVHFTPRMDGSVWLGPNAILALQREGYSWSDVNISELWDTLKYRGFQKLASKYLSYGTSEMMKSAFTKLQVKDLKKFVPLLEASDVVRGPAGVRAQALNAAGDLVDDFVFDTGRYSIGKRILHCRNAPSPGATSSLAIAKHIANRVEEQFSIR